MPFLRGAGPIRRTLKYLEASPLIFRNNVCIFTMNYDTKNEHHRGAREFWFWHMGQIQHCNPCVQMDALENRFPTPFARSWLDTGEDVIMDLFGKSREEIMSHLIYILGKTREQIKQEAHKKELNPALFGGACKRHCICEVPGQVPCPSVALLPKTLRGKFRHTSPEELGELYDYSCFNNTEIRYPMQYKNAVKE